MNDQTAEAEKVAKAMAALDAMATVWAASFDIRQAVCAMKSLPDGDDRLSAFIKQAHCEGLYAGRTSLKVAQPVQPANPVPDGWKLVPIEPTKEMWAAVNKLDDQMSAGGFDGKGCSIEQAWDCLVESAPTSPACESIAQPVPQKSGEKALDLACHFQNLACEQEEIIELFCLDAAVAQAEPLSEFEIMQIIGQEFPLPLVEPKVLELIESVCRRIEAAHGIGAQE